MEHVIDKQLMEYRAIQSARFHEIQQKIIEKQNEELAIKIQCAERVKSHIRRVCCKLRNTRQIAQMLTSMRELCEHILCVIDDYADLQEVREEVLRSLEIICSHVIEFNILTDKEKVMQFQSIIDEITQMIGARDAIQIDTSPNTDNDEQIAQEIEKMVI